MSILSLAAGNVAAWKGDIALSKELRCEVSQVKRRVEEKAAHHPRRCDAIRASPIEDSARKRGTTLAKKYHYLIRVKRT